MGTEVSIISIRYGTNEAMNAAERIGDSPGKITVQIDCSFWLKLWEASLYPGNGAKIVIRYNHAFHQGGFKYLSSILFGLIKHPFLVLDVQCVEDIRPLCRYGMWPKDLNKNRGFYYGLGLLPVFFLHRIMVALESLRISKADPLIKLMTKWSFFEDIQLGPLVH